MKVYPLLVGNIDIEGNEALVDIYYSYELAMIAAKRKADKVIRESEGEARTYKAFYWYGDEGDPHASVGRVSLYTDDPAYPDYWWNVETKIVST